jgi:hypothetical protein
MSATAATYNEEQDQGWQLFEKPEEMYQLPDYPFQIPLSVTRSNVIVQLVGMQALFKEVQHHQDQRIEDLFSPSPNLREAARLWVKKQIKSGDGNKVLGQILKHIERFSSSQKLTEALDFVTEIGPLAVKELVTELNHGLSFTASASTWEDFSTRASYPPKVKYIIGHAISRANLDLLGQLLLDSPDLVIKAAALDAIETHTSDKAKIIINKFLAAIDANHPLWKRAVALLEELEEFSG